MCPDGGWETDKLSEALERGSFPSKESSEHQQTIVLDAAFGFCCCSVTSQNWQIWDLEVIWYWLQDFTKVIFFICQLLKVAYDLKTVGKLD